MHIPNLSPFSVYTDYKKITFFDSKSQIQPYSFRNDSRIMPRVVSQLMVWPVLFWTRKDVIFQLSCWLKSKLQIKLLDDTCRTHSEPWARNRTKGKSLELKGQSGGSQLLPLCTAGARLQTWVSLAHCWPSRSQPASWNTNDSLICRAVGISICHLGVGLSHNRHKRIAPRQGAQ